MPSAVTRAALDDGPDGATIQTPEQASLLYNFVNPLSAPESQGENDGSDAPVAEHTDPDAHWADACYSDEEGGHANSAKPHGKARNDHGKLNVACCAEAIGCNT